MWDTENPNPEKNNGPLRTRMLPGFEYLNNFPQGEACDTLNETKVPCHTNCTREYTLCDESSLSVEFSDDVGEWLVYLTFNETYNLIGAVSPQSAVEYLDNLILVLGKARDAILSVSTLPISNQQ